MIGDKQSIRRDRNLLISALHELARRQGKSIRIRGNAAQCPFHDDQKASGSIYQGEDGAWRFTCHPCKRGGDYFDLMAEATGQSVASLLREHAASLSAHSAPKPSASTPSASGSTSSPAPRAPLFFKTLEEMRAFYIAKGFVVEDTYLYGRKQPPEIRMVVLRLRDGEGKTFKQARPARGGFEMTAPAGLHPLFNLGGIEAAANILVCEGEKAVKAAQGYLPAGWAATTSPGGAGKSHLADWSPLSGKKKVVLFPDADEPDRKTGKIAGQLHMEQVRQCLLALPQPPPQFWIDAWNLDLPPKGDVVEYLASFTSDQDKHKGLSALLEGAEPLGVSRNILQFIEKVIRGEIRAIEWPWTLLTRLTQALLPGTVTAICGDPGCSKSLLAIQCLWFWFMDGVKCAIFELEDDAAYHIRRAIAQLEGNGELTQLDWIARPENQAAARAAHQHWAEFVDQFESCVSAAPESQPTYADLLRWARARAGAGCRVIVIDPITMARHVTREIWEEDTTFLNDIKTVAREGNCSIVLVTHPKKGARNGSLDDLSGGAAFPRFSHTVLWIIKHDQRQAVTTASDQGLQHLSINRTIQIRKARNGRGGGMNLAFEFDPRTIRFEERGVIRKSEDGGEPPF